MKSIGVFCGSSAGESAVYMDAARETGAFFAARGVDVVYGGGRVGLMGAVADSALQQGGSVTGVMPQALVEREIAHRELTHLHVVENMHQRKTRMAELSSFFIALPGGAGTLEEIFEQWTWGQLGIHNKPCAFYNVNNFYSPLKVMVEKIVTEGFMKQSYSDMLLFSDDLQEIMNFFENYIPPTSKWQK